jgi:hypothetical protein
MFNIPNADKKFTITNTSDVSGNIWYTKNINFDEDGYIKLSSRSVAIQTEADDADFGMPTAFGRTNISSFLVATSDKPWILNQTTQGLLSQEDTDTGTPGAMTFNSSGTWWQNKWHVTTNGALYYKSGSTWTNAYSTSFTANVYHPIEVFRNRQTIVIGNGNAVKQLNTSYAVSTLAQLTIPADYEILSIKYSNARVGIITKLSGTAAEQNQEAYFFVWDGISSEAGSGIPIGSDSIIQIAPYKSSWVILTRTGQLLYYNGGGFTELDSLPYYATGTILGDSANKLSAGDPMQVEGDLIYINLNNDLSGFGKYQEVFLENFPSGIICYDPKVGLHHRYSASISRLRTATVAEAEVNTTTGLFTAGSAVVPATGNPVLYTYDSSDLIGGLNTGTIYYVIRVTTSSFKLATTKQNAIDGQWITPTSQGATFNYFAFLDVKDYGISYSDGRTGATSMVSYGSDVADHLIFGGEYWDYNSTTFKGVACITVPYFPNIGYIVSPKLESGNIEDTFKKLFSKYRPMDENDSITIKVKTEEILGVPVSAPQRNSSATVGNWTGANTFTTTALIGHIKTLVDAGTEIECEITAGGGAGQMSKITSITGDSTYTVTLEDDLDGAESGSICAFIMNNWTTLETVTNGHPKLWKEMTIGRDGLKSVKLKVILKGVGVTVEQLKVVNEAHIEAK